MEKLQEELDARDAQILQLQERLQNQQRSQQQAQGAFAFGSKPPSNYIAPLTSAIRTANKYPSVDRKNKRVQLITTAHGDDYRETVAKFRPQGSQGDSKFLIDWGPASRKVEQAATSIIETLHDDLNAISEGGYLEAIKNQSHMLFLADNKNIAWGILRTCLSIVDYRTDKWSFNWVPGAAGDYKDKIPSGQCFNYWTLSKGSKLASGHVPHHIADSIVKAKDQEPVKMDEEYQDFEPKAPEMRDDAASNVRVSFPRNGVFAFFKDAKVGIKSARQCRFTVTFCLAAFKDGKYDKPASLTPLRSYTADCHKTPTRPVNYFNYSMKNDHRIVSKFFENLFQVAGIPAHIWDYVLAKTNVFDYKAESIENWARECNVTSQEMKTYLTKMLNFQVFVVPQVVNHGEISDALSIDAKVTKILWPADNEASQYLYLDYLRAQMHYVNKKVSYDIALTQRYSKQQKEFKNFKEDLTEYQKNLLEPNKVAKARNPIDRLSRQVAHVEDHRQNKYSEEVIKHLMERREKSDAAKLLAIKNLRALLPDYNEVCTDIYSKENAIEANKIVPVKLYGIVYKVGELKEEIYDKIRHDKLQKKMEKEHAQMMADEIEDNHTHFTNENDYQSAMRSQSHGPKRARNAGRPYSYYQANPQPQQQGGNFTNPNNPNLPGPNWQWQQPFENNNSSNNNRYQQEQEIEMRGGGGSDHEFVDVEEDKHSEYSQAPKSRIKNTVYESGDLEEGDGKVPRLKKAIQKVPKKNSSREPSVAGSPAHSSRMNKKQLKQIKGGRNNKNNNNDPFDRIDEEENEGNDQ